MTPFGFFVLLSIWVSNAASTVDYHVTGNTFASQHEYTEPTIFYGSPPTRVFLVSAGESAAALPADAPVNPGDTIVRWPSRANDNYNATRFGPILHGLSVFDVYEHDLDIGDHETVTITFFLSVKNPQSRGIIFGIIENVWRYNLTHPIADELNDIVQGSASGGGALGSYIALAMKGDGGLHFVSSGTKEPVALKASTQLLDGNWHHVAIAVDIPSLYVQLFIDAKTSYSDPEWFRCFSGEPQPFPGKISPNVAARYGSDPNNLLIPDGAMVFGYGFRGSSDIAIALFQVYDRTMTQPEVAVLCGHVEHIGVTPRAGYSLGFAILAISMIAATITAFTSYAEHREGAPEALHKAILHTSSCGAASGSEEAGEESRFMMGAVEAISQGTAMAGQAAGAMSRASLAMQQVSAMGCQNQENVTMMKKLAAIVPVAVAPLQGLALYIEGWQWPPEFVAVMERITSFFALELPFHIPNMPPFVWLLLKCILAIVFVVSIVRYITADDSSFEAASRKHRIIRILHRDSIRKMLLKVMNLPPRHPFIDRASLLIAAANRADWEADDLSRIVVMEDEAGKTTKLRKDIAEAFVTYLRLVPPPTNEYEAALQNFAVSALNLSPYECNTLLDACHDIASALVGTGRDEPCGNVINVVGRVSLNEKNRIKLAEMLLIAGGSIAWNFDDSMTDNDPIRAADIVKQQIRDFCVEHGIEEPGMRYHRGRGKTDVSRGPKFSCKKCFRVLIAEDEHWCCEKCSIELCSVCVNPDAPSCIKCRGELCVPLHFQSAIRFSIDHDADADQEDAIQAPLLEEERIECAFRSKILPEIAAAPALAPSAVAPSPAYKMILQKMQAKAGLRDQLGVAISCSFIVCDGPGYGYLLSAANDVCRFRSLKQSFEISAIAVRPVGLQRQPIIVLEESCVEAAWNEAAPQLHVLVSGPSAYRGTYSLFVSVVDKIVCPAHHRCLIAAQPEHFGVRMMDSISAVPYRCVHSTNESFKVSEAFRLEGTQVAEVLHSKQQPEGGDDMNLLVPLEMTRSVLLRLQQSRRNAVNVRPCANDVLYVCPEATCRYTVCDQCARLTFSEGIRVQVATLIHRLNTPDIHRLLLLLLLALLFPLTKDAIMVLACHPTVRCPLGTSDDGGCYGKGATPSFMVAFVLALFAILIFRLGLTAWLFWMLWARKGAVNSTIATEWIGAQHPEWEHFLRSDDSVMSILYSKFEIKFFLAEQPWLLAWQLADCLAVALTDPNSMWQLLLAAIVELASLVYLMITNPFIDMWQDLLAKGAALHQLLQLSLMFIHRAAEAQSSTGSSGKVVGIMLSIGVSYLAFFVFVLWKRVVRPYREWQEQEDAEALLRHQRLLLSMPDTQQALPLLRELAIKFSMAFGWWHPLTAIAEAHVYALSVEGMFEASLTPGGADSANDIKEDVDSRMRCLEALCWIDASQPIGIKWRPLNEIDDFAREHIGKVLQSVFTSPDNEELLKKFDQISERLDAVLLACRQEQDRTFAAGNVLTILASIGKPVSNKNFSQLHILNADASGSELQDISFQKSIIRDSTFRGTVFKNVDFTDAQPRNVEKGATRRSREALIDVKGHTRLIWRATYSHDGSQICSASKDKTIRVSSALTGELVAEMTEHTGPVYCVTFSPNGEHLLSASHDKTLRVWDTTTWTAIGMLRGHSDAVYCGAYSPDGSKIVSASADKVVCVWGSFMGQLLAELRGHSGPVYNVAYSPSGTSIVSASADKTLRIWDVFTGEVLHVLDGHSGEVRCTAFSPDGARIVSASVDKTIRVWSCDNLAEQWSTESELNGHAGIVQSVAFSPDSTRILSASTDGTVLVWGSDGLIWKNIVQLKGHTDCVFSAEYSKDGSRIISAGGDKVVRVWDSSTGLSVSNLQMHSGSITGVSFSPDGTNVVSCSTDRTARVWNAATGQQVAVLRGHGAEVSDVSFSPNGKWLATSSSTSTLRVWSTATWKVCATLRCGSSGKVTSVEFSSDSTQIVNSLEKIICVWAFPEIPLEPSDKLVTTCDTPKVYLKGHSGEITCAAFCPDGSRIVSSSHDFTVRIWDVSAAKSVAELIGHTNWVWSAAFSPDGLYVVSASKDTTVRIWNAETFQQMSILRGHTSYVWSAIFTPDSQHVISASYDRTLRIWETVSWKTVETIDTGHRDSIRKACCSPNGTRVLSASSDGTLRMWDLSQLQSPPIDPLELTPRGPSEVLTDASPLTPTSMATSTCLTPKHLENTELTNDSLATPNGFCASPIASPEKYSGDAAGSSPSAAPKSATLRLQTSANSFGSNGESVDSEGRGVLFCGACATDGSAFPIPCSIEEYRQQGRLVWSSESPIFFINCMCNDPRRWSAGPDPGLTAEPRQLLRYDPNFSFEWYRLGDALNASSDIEETRTVIIDGESYTARGCYIEALRCNQENMYAWTSLGTTMRNAEEKIDVLKNGTTFTRIGCFVESLRCSEDYIHAWACLGNALGDKETITFNGRSYCRKDCYVEALRRDPKNTHAWAVLDFSYAWNCLGNALSGSDTIEIEIDELNVSLSATHKTRRYFTKKECYIEALKCNLLNSTAWNSLGEALSADESVETNLPESLPQHVSQKDCFAEAVKCDLDNSSAWSNLGGVLTGSQFAVLNGNSFHQKHCFAEVLRINRSCIHAWRTLGDILSPGETVVVNSVTCSKKHCYVNCLRTDPSIGAVWTSLGDSLEQKSDSAKVNGKIYVKKFCYVEALRHDRFNCRAWRALANILDDNELVEVEGNRYTKNDCQSEASMNKTKTDTVEESMNHGRIWFDRGLKMTVADAIDIEGHRYTKKECFVEALQYNPNFGPAWHWLGNILSTTDSLRIGEKMLSKKDCYVEALRRDEFYAPWFCTAILMDATETIEVRGKAYTKKDCFHKAILDNRDCVEAWKHLADEMDDKDTVKIGHKRFSKDACMAMYADLVFAERVRKDPESAAAWTDLGNELPSTQTIEIKIRASAEGKKHGDDESIAVECTKQKCFLRALRIKFGHAPAWLSLGKSLGDKDSLVVNGELCMKRTCYKKALRFDPDCSEAWFCLGLTFTHSKETFSVDADRRSKRGGHSKKDCFLEAVYCDADNACAWLSLAYMMRPNEAVEIRPKNEKRMKAFTRSHCFREALKRLPTSAEAWHGMGFSMRNSDCEIEGIGIVTQRDCYFKALTINPSYSDAWCSLAVSLNALEDVITFGEGAQEKSYNKRQCFLKALQCSDANSYAWTSLGTSMVGKDTCTLNGKRYTRMLCFIQALRLNPHDSIAWANLANIISDKEKVEVLPNKKHSKLDCYVEALRSDHIEWPEKSKEQSWWDLGQLLGDMEFVEIDGQKYDADSCRSRGQRVGRERNEENLWKLK